MGAPGEGGEVAGVAGVDAVADAGFVDVHGQVVVVFAGVVGVGAGEDVLDVAVCVADGGAGVFEGLHKAESFAEVPVGEGGEADGGAAEVVELPGEGAEAGKGGVGVVCGIVVFGPAGEGVEVEGAEGVAQLLGAVA